MSNIFLASQRRLLASSMRMAKNQKRLAQAFFSTQVEDAPPPLETFLNGTSSLYAEQMYEMYLEDPSSVQESWRLYFDNEESSTPFDSDAFTSPTSIPGKRSAAAAGVRCIVAMCCVASCAPSIGAPPVRFAIFNRTARLFCLFFSSRRLIDAVRSFSFLLLQGAAPSDSLAISHLIRAYQVNGHEAANLDPLELFTDDTFPYRPKPQADGYPSNLELEYYGFTEEDLDRKLHFKGRGDGGQRGYLEELAKAPDKVTLRAILGELRKTYCGTLGVEYMHIGDPDKMNWIRERMENPYWNQYDKEKKAHIFERLCFADTFENFMAYKFNTTKRFGLDGGEAVVPGLKDAIDRASELGATSFVLGMPHRGRLNVLANVMRKPMPLIFSEFAGTHYSVDEYYKKDNDNHGFSGDVKYHLGSSMDRTYPDGRRIHMSLVANPSHLECVDPLVIGKSRAKQYYQGDR